MPITAEQKLERRKHIGGSDMAAILGLSRFRTPYDVWLDKTGQYDGSPESDAAHAGNRFEAAVLDEAQDRLGPLERNIFLPAPDNLPIAVNLDARIIATHEPVEAKTSGLFGALHPDWGEEGTDEIPEEYIVQVQTEMLCANANLCHVVAFLGGRGFQMYRVERNRQLTDILVARAVEFWEKHVKANIPPADSVPSIEVIKHIRRTPDKSVEIAPEVLAAWLTSKEALKQAEAEEEGCKVGLLTAMGDAEAGLCGELGNVTFMSQTRSGVDATRLKTEQPDVYQQFVKNTAYRVLRHSKPKTKKGTPAA